MINRFVKKDYLENQFVNFEKDVLQEKYVDIDTLGDGMTDDEVDDLFGDSEQEIDSTKRAVNDTLISTSTIWSSSKTSTEISAAETRTKQYVTDALGSSYHMNLKPVEELPEAPSMSNVVYIKEVEGTNQLFVYSGEEWINIGSFSQDFGDYVSHSELETELEPYALKSSTLTADNIVQNLDDPKTTTVLSTSALLDIINELKAMIVASATEPTQTENQIWLKPVE